MDPDSLSDLRTVVSELVSISVSHGATAPIELSFELSSGMIEGVVGDCGPGARAAARAREGWGTSIAVRVIESLVDDWGVSSDETSIWFRMEVGQAG